MVCPFRDLGVDMGWRTLLFSAKGRLGRRDFWTAWFLLAIATAALRMFGVVGELLGLLLAFPQICLFSKRLHDVGRSGWWAGLIAGLACLGRLAADVLKAAQSVGPDAKYYAEAAPIQAAASVVVVVCTVTAIGLFYRFGARRGDPADNRYGPPPARALPNPQPARSAGNA